MLTDTYAAVGMMLAMGVLLAVAERLARRSRFRPETTRKLVHAVGGVACLSFPLLFRSSLTVFLLGLCFGLFFWVAEERQWLRCLCGVTRRSKGSLYYPFAIALLFALTRDAYRLYAAAVLVLTVADSGAALVGSRYGRVRFRTGAIGETKSLEGSLAFGLLGFFAVFVPLILPPGSPPFWHAFLPALLSALLLTFVEAVSGGGRDNLYLPPLTAFMLIKMAGKPLGELVMQTASIVLLFGVLMMLNRHGRVLRSRALVIFGIFVYAIWSLGSVDWAIPLVAAFACFAAVFAATGSEHRRTLAHRRIVLLSLPGALVALFANLTGTFAFCHGPFLAALLVPGIWGVVMQLRHSGEGQGWTARQGGGALVMIVAILLQPICFGRAPGWLPVGGLAAGALVLVWAGIVLMAGMRWPGTVVSFCAVWIAILLVGSAQLAGWSPLWRPSRWDDRYGRKMDVLLPLPALHRSVSP